ncbi:proteasome ATPase [Helcobacillus massiliensis]|uniref:AAA ATPase forming ring-shaped complexes n=1 Tax=Helcobacillus massiliensis TaxID=521392 RepID=A0A839R1K5_9MICO|nr:proteasome ATPase [Helcobacillus massiliensis]MBB3022446.1 proteasome-associated ATPase [Helcobacillus massiliensis]MDK7741151.1 proteasome ATPase [Helcobacillus massiliensis]WOO93958.1 proteasome ATPase [Helcobacillus massiliensis]
MKTYQELSTELNGLAKQNERLVASLTKAREQILDLRSDLERMADPPNPYATFLQVADGTTVDVLHNGRKLRIATSPEVDPATLTRGQELRMNEALVAVEAMPTSDLGNVASAVEQLPDGRILVQVHADEQRVMHASSALAGTALSPGDHLMVDLKAGIVLERLERKEITDLVLEHVPDTSYGDIGGLQGQIEAIRDAVELPFLHQDLYREYGLRPPKGVLLYGPPGCGKTMIAKAVAHELALKAAQMRGEDADSALGRTWFINVKGPEILNKYVGETERSIRLVFERAREKASDGHPVVVFFDEMDSLFRTRGTGVSSDVESTIVPQLLSEIDGVESLENVIVIGASNREDMIDPAIVRPGRLDVKIRIQRPDEAAAREILALYLNEDVPVQEDRTRLVEQTAALIYRRTEDLAFVDVEYADGSEETLFFGDFMSGAMLRNIVDRAKKAAVKDFLASAERGITMDHLEDAVFAELRENEDLPSNADPDDWARVAGRRGQRIVQMHPRRASEAAHA